MERKGNKIPEEKSICKAEIYHFFYTPQVTKLLILDIFFNFAPIKIRKYERKIFFSCAGGVFRLFLFPANEKCEGTA
jgi:hypothetical protein